MAAMASKKIAVPAVGGAAVGRKVAAAEQVQVRCLLADDVRVEQTGKIIGIGMYLDNVILFETPEDQPDPTAEAPIAMHQFAVVATFTGPEGDYMVSFGIGDDKPKERSIHLGPQRSINLIWHFRPLLIASLGVKRITVSVDKVKHVFMFEMRRRTPYVAPHPKRATRRKSRPEQ